MIYPYLAAQFYPGYRQTKAKVVTTTTDEIWFRSRMKYWIPELDADRAKDVWSSELLRRLYGLELTPALLWELLPWSWLADWFGAFGSWWANYSYQTYDNLAAKYAYIMRKRRILTLYDQKQPMNGGPGVSLSALTVAESKERAAASPYGFGLDWPDFSESQQLILLALGISRIR